jgi:putative methionine-R-sulfoxide reductase with GAF domain
MTKTARIDRASGTNVGERRVALRLGRRLRSDPHVLLALALAIPTIVVNFLDQGPDELAVTILAIAFLAIQTGLTVVGPSLGLGESRHSNRALLTSGSVPVIDAWSLLRLILAVGFVALAAYATADPTSVPLAPLYIPVIATAAVIGPGEAVIVLIAVAIARLAPLVGGAGEAAVTEQGVVLGVVGIVLANGTRRTVASLNVALDRLRTTNASARRRNRQIAGIDAVGRTLAADGPKPSSLQAVMNLLTGPFGYSHGSIYLGEALGGSPTELRMGAQHGYDVPIPVFDGTMGVIGRVIRTGQPALVADVHADPDYIGAASGLRSEVCAPLIAGDELLGIVNVGSDRDVLDEHDLEIIRLVAERLASARVTSHNVV